MSGRMTHSDLIDIFHSLRNIGPLINNKHQKDKLKKCIFIPEPMELAFL